MFQPSRSRSMDSKSAHRKVKFVVKTQTPIKVLIKINLKKPHTVHNRNIILQIKQLKKYKTIKHKIVAFIKDYLSHKIKGTKQVSTTFQYGKIAQIRQG